MGDASPARPDGLTPDGGIDFGSIVDEFLAEGEQPAAAPKPEPQPRPAPTRGLPDAAELEKIVFRQQIRVAETGEVLNLERNAREALADTEAEVTKLKRLLACLTSS